MSRREIKAENKTSTKVKNRDFWMPFAPIILDRFTKKLNEWGHSN